MELKRNMHIIAMTLMVLALAGMPVHAQSDFQGDTGKSLADSRTFRLSAAQETEHLQTEHAGAEHAFHRNHFGGFLGASTHSDNDETGFTLGLEYARQFTPRWAAAAYTELVAGNLERDVIIAAGAIFYLVPRLGLVFAPGVELAKIEVERDGEVEKEDETEFLLRVGAGYSFPVGQASLGPVVMVDHTGDRWTFVYGLGMVTGF